LEEGDGLSILGESRDTGVGEALERRRGMCKARKVRIHYLDRGRARKGDKEKELRG